jgi:hypothetical protein
MDLTGRIRVKLCAEDGNLVAYGFGGSPFTLALPPLAGLLVLRVRRVRERRAKELVDDLTV